MWWYITWECCGISGSCEWKYDPTGDLYLPHSRADLDHGHNMISQIFLKAGWRYTAEMRFLSLLCAVCAVSSPLSLCCFQRAFPLSCCTKGMFKEMRLRAREQTLTAGPITQHNPVVSGGLPQSPTMPDDRILEENEAAGHAKERSGSVSAGNTHVCSFWRRWMPESFWFRVFIILGQNIASRRLNVPEVGEMAPYRPQSKQFATHLVGKDLFCRRRGVNGAQLGMRWCLGLCSNPFE